MEIKVTTLEQLKYWLNQNEIVRMKLIDSDGYIKKEGNNVLVITQPRFGKSTTMKGKFKNIEKVFNDFKKCDLHVVRGGELISRDVNVIDKLIDKFKKDKE
jgi:phosphoketolase